MLEQLEQNIESHEPLTFAERALVQRLPLFENIGADALDLILKDAALYRVPTKTIILREGDQPDCLYILIDGLVQLYTTDEDREATVLILQPVTTFITAAVLRNDVLLTSARAIQPSHLLRLRADLARQLMQQNINFAGAVAKDLALNYRNAIRELKNMRAKSAFERLIAWLLTMQAQAGTSEVEIPFDKSLLAARLGMAPETLSRDLARLAEFGVTMRGRKLHIADIDKLRASTWTDEWHQPSVP